ncbi:QWRF motif-containing protein 7 [Vigna angularis]|uniref:QWRF motif-containing protein 7 n=1 Tax=Phaseolus angularis TaxID=3914 RepID=UPI000809DDAE|nr:QWRF motif-containing protein 7 [Vigna angularis]
MDKPFHGSSCRNHLTVVAPSPRLVRSRSGNGSAAAAITTPERSSGRLSSSERFTISSIQRSKSTSRTRTTNKDEGNMNLNPTSIRNKQTNTRVQDKKNKDDSFGKILQRGVSPDNNNNVGASKRTSSSVKSPSAWALSPGRWSLGSPIWPQPQTKTSLSVSSGVGGSVNKVLKYFKQKKVSPMQEEEYHQFRVLHNRLLQWRFINARANVAMANVKTMVEIQLFAVWVGIVKLRKIRTEKRVELRKVKDVMKLYKILNGQLYLLSEWAQLERRNQEYVAKLTRKLSAFSNIIPLTYLKVDTGSISDALNAAITVMEDLEPLITKYHTKVNGSWWRMKKLHDDVAQRHEELAIRFRDACGGAFGTMARPLRDMFAKGFWLGFRNV